MSDIQFDNYSTVKNKENQIKKIYANQKQSNLDTSAVNYSSIKSR